jgi:hypothetical protein
MEGGEATKGLGPEKKGGGGTHSSLDGGEVAAGQSSGRGGATWSAREKARGEELGRRPAWGDAWELPEQEVASAELRRRPATASSCWWLGQRRSGVARLGKASRKGLRRWRAQGQRVEARRGRGSSGGAARRPAVALLCGRGEQRKKKGGRGRHGLRCKLQKLKGPHCNTKFPTILKLK